MAVTTTKIIIITTQATRFLFSSFLPLSKQNHPRNYTMTVDTGLVAYLSAAPGTFIQSWCHRVEVKPRIFSTMYVEGVEGQKFSLHLGLKRNHEFKDHSVGFCLRIDGKTVALRCYKTSDLVALWNENKTFTIAQKDGFHQPKASAGELKFGNPTCKSLSHLPNSDISKLICS